MGPMRDRRQEVKEAAASRAFAMGGAASDALMPRRAACSMKFAVWLVVVVVVVLLLLLR